MKGEPPQVKALSQVDLPGGYKRDFFRRLGELRDGQPSSTDRMLCEYFAARYREAAFKAAEAIAYETGVSKATVIRFARRIGFPSFAELQKRLQQIVHYDLTAVDWAQLPEQDDFVAAKVVARELQNLRQLQHGLNRDELDAAVRLLIEAPTLTVLGFRTSAALAQHAAYNLRKILVQVFLFTQADSTLLDHLRLYQGQGAALAIGFSRYDRRFIEAVAVAKEFGYPILAVSEAHDSPLARLATLDLVAPATFESFVGAYAAPITLLTALISHLAQVMGPRAKERLKALEGVAEKYQTFY